MVLEFIVSSNKLRHTPYIMFLEAIFLTFLSLILSIFIFPEQYASITFLAFITIGATPLLNKLYSRDCYFYNYNKPFLQRHKKLILLLFFFFLGILVSIIFIYFILPSNYQTNLFSSQLSELDSINNIRNSVTGKIIDNSINSSSFGKVFTLIFKNNLIVVFSALILSFFYGAGSIFLISWNASILGLVIAKSVYDSLIFNGPLLLKPFFIMYKVIITLLGYIPHGLPEVLAYLIASFMGALFARDLLKGIFSTEFKWSALKDISFTFLLVIILLIVAAFIEASYFI